MLTDIISTQPGPRLTEPRRGSRRSRAGKGSKRFEGSSIRFAEAAADCAQLEAVLTLRSKRR